MRLTARLSATVALAAAALTLTAGAASANYQDTTEKLGVSTSVIEPGGKVTVSGDGFQASSTVALELHSEPISLGTTTTDSNGGFSAAVAIPSSAPKGKHTIVAIGVDPDGNPRTVSVPVQVGSLPFTGSSAVIPLILLAGGAALVGGGVLVAAKRRQNA